MQEYYFYMHLFHFFKKEIGTILFENYHKLLAEYLLPDPDHVIV